MSDYVLEVVEVRLPGVASSLWIRRENLTASDGSLMPSPTHDIDTFGLGDSFAHLFPDGTIRRHGDVIGKLDDLEEVIHE